MKKYSIVLALIVWTGACGSGATDPTKSSLIPPLGRYQINIKKATGNPFYSVPTNGVLTVIYAKADSIAGYMNDEDYNSTVKGGFFNITAYWVTLSVKPYNNMMIVRLKPIKGGMECESASYLDGPTVRPSECSVKYIGQ